MTHTITTPHKFTIDPDSYKNTTGSGVVDEIIIERDYGTTCLQFALGCDSYAHGSPVWEINGKLTTNGIVSGSFIALGYSPDQHDVMDTADMESDEFVSALSLFFAAEGRDYLGGGLAVIRYIELHPELRGKNIVHTWMKDSLEAIDAFVKTSVPKSVQNSLREAKFYELQEKFEEEVDVLQSNTKLSDEDCDKAYKALEKEHEAKTKAISSKVYQLNELASVDFFMYSGPFRYPKFEFLALWLDPVLFKSIGLELVGDENLAMDAIERKFSLEAPCYEPTVMRGNTMGFMETLHRMGRHHLGL